MKKDENFSGTLMWIPGLLTSGRIVKVTTLEDFTDQYRHLMINGKNIYGAIVTNNKVNWFFSRCIKPANTKKVTYSMIPDNFKTHLLLLGFDNNDH